MGRKSMADKRRKEILDAFETCINTHGFSQSTTRRIADIAGVKQPMIAHYFGNKGGMVKALVARLEADYLSRLTDSLGNAIGHKRLKLAFDFLFNPAVLGGGQQGILLGQLLAAISYDEGLRLRMVRMYKRFLYHTEAEIQRAFPSADKRKCRRTAYGILSLGIGNDLLVSVWLKLPNRNLARACAEQLIAGLRN